MKITNIIKLLSVLLCIFALFAACDSTEETTTVETTEQETTSVETEEETRGEVEPILDNFFTFSETDSWLELGDATRLDGTCVSKSANNEIVVLRSAEIDTMNVVTETFTVYNTVLGKAVLTFKNTYDYDKYSAFNWNNIYVTDENIKYPESVMKVEVKGVGNYNTNSTYIIKVSKASVTPTPEATLEENENANYYTIDVNCEYYDIAGTKIVDTKYDTFISHNSTLSSEILSCVQIGDTNAFFNADTMELVKTVKADNQIAIAGYDDETEKYGYFFGTHGIALGGSVKFVEVYDKASSKCILTHYFDPAEKVETYVLENGNIFVQISNSVDKDAALPYDYEINGEKFTLDSYILNVKNDTMNEIECNFIVASLVHVTENTAEDLDSVGIKITDNVDNIAVVRYINDGKADHYKLAVIDNKFEVLFVLDNMVPEQYIALDNGFGFKIIEDGNYLVDLYNVVTSRAIVSPDGKIRCYLNENDVIVGKYVVNEYGIFDYDMKLLYDFEENGVSFSTTVGDKIIVSGLIEIFEEIEEDNDNNNFFPEEETTGVDDTEEETTEEEYKEPIEVYVEYYVITVDDEGNFDFKTIYDYDDRMELVSVSSNSDYVIFRSNKTGKYSLYNVELKHVLTTQNIMSIFRCEDNYIVSTQLSVDGELIDIFYTIAPKAAE